MIIDYRGIWGIDVSKWQSDPVSGKRIDFTKAKALGCSFAIPKIGQYNYYDYDSDYNWRAAKDAGLARGSYWFLDYRDTGKNQAQRYFAFFERMRDLGEGIHVVDFENGSGGDYNQVYNFMVEFQRLSGLPDHKIALYSAYYYWLEHAPASESSRLWFAKYPYWHAWYINGAPNTSVRDVENYYANNASGVLVPPKWTNPPSPIIWQAGTPAIGLMLGAQSKEIDFNLFNGDAELFKKYFGAEVSIPEPPLPPEGETGMYNLIVLATYLNGRVSPGGSINFPSGSSFSTGFRKDDVLEASEKSNANNMDWYRITKCTRNGANVQLPDPVWAAAGETYGYMRLYTPPPEETVPAELYMSFVPGGKTYRYVKTEG